MKKMKKAVLYFVFFFFPPAILLTKFQITTLQDWDVYLVPVLSVREQSTWHPPLRGSPTFVVHWKKKKRLMNTDRQVDMLIIIAYCTLKSFQREFQGFSGKRACTGKMFFQLKWVSYALSTRSVWYVLSKSSGSTLGQPSGFSKLIFPSFVPLTWEREALVVFQQSQLFSNSQ